MIQSNHYGFFTFYGNDIMHKQFCTLLPSTSVGSGRGVYIYHNNIRQSISLFCIKSIPKNTWCNSDNVYIGRRVENDTK